ncbi:MAG: MFS transporter [bacterium]
MMRPDEMEDPTLRATLRRVLVAWLFGAAWMSITSGATLTRFAREMGVREFGFGLMAALPFLAAFAQLPASFFVERFGHRKTVFLAFNLTHRLMWLVIAAIPWLFPRFHWPAALIALMGLSAVASQVTGPAWNSWFVDLVPSRIRGRYMSRRSQAGQMVNLVLTLTVGLALDWAEGKGIVALGRMLSAVLAVAAVMGAVDILYFVGIPDRAAPPRDRSYGLRQLFLQPLKNRSFRYCLAFTAVLTFSVGLMGQFTWLYVFDVVKATNAQANLLLIAFPLAVSLISLPFWGRMVDRLGRKPVLIIAGICVIPGALAWVFIREGHWFPGYFGVILSAFGWPGIELGYLNILLGLMERRKGNVRNTAYMAINSVVVAAAGTLSGLFSGLLASQFRDWHGSVWGVALTYHSGLFLISTVVRTCGLLFLRGIEEPRAFSARDAFRYMAGTMYSNLQNTLVAPVRLAGRWTYKLSSVRRRGKK